jgi:electron transfer flavoprotein beta subunit
LSDDFIETLEMHLPGLVTITTQANTPRYPHLGGLETAFAQPDIKILGASDLGLDPEKIGVKGSPTKIINVYSPTAEKKNMILKGTAKKIVDEIFDKYGDRISGAIGKDLKTHYHDKKS